MKSTISIMAGVICIGAAPTAWGQGWISLVDQTNTRIVAPANISTSDPEEKDLGYGDFDNDGDIDLVVVRKQPLTTIGRKRNVLFMNEGIAEGHAFNGVLVERTTEYGSAADDGGQGLLDLTADRDVVVTDVNSDGWMDLVTAPTYGQGLPKSISHPRVYINLGENAGVWQGFKYEEARIPTLASAPNFCGVSAGDVNGDKSPDLHFVDYDNVTTSVDDDRLLINNGSGFFTDQTSSRLTAAMTTSAFGISSSMADMNGDGWLDIIKNENGPTKVLYNGGNGFFTTLQNAYGGASYFANVADLNKDGKIDIVVSDDGTDRYLLNTGTPGNPTASFAQFTFPPISGGFGSSQRFADLNNDTNMDVLIADVDVDAGSCTNNNLHLYRNLGNLPNITLADQGLGGLPSSALLGTYDVAVFDLDGNGRLDLIVGRCVGLRVFMNQDPVGIIFSYPQGLPSFLPTGETYTFQLSLAGVGGASIQPGTATLFYTINHGTFSSVPLTSIGANLYEVVLPATVCTDIVSWYVTAQTTTGTTFRDPPSAPAATFDAIGADGSEITVEDGLEGDTSGWSVQNDVGLNAGGWQVVDPIGTINLASFAAPEDDSGAGDDVNAFVTANGAEGGAANASDVDGGWTRLVSPVINLEGSDATVSYDTWFYCEDAGTADGDVLKVEVSADGMVYVLVEQITTTNGGWENSSFRVGDFITPSANVRVRFSTADIPNNSITEAGIDNFVVDQLICGGGEECIGDVSPTGGDGEVNIDDLFGIIAAWGTADPQYDIVVSGDVDIDDLFAVIAQWGTCP